MSHSTPSRPRLSGIPGPGPRASTSGLPTPSRRKSSLAPSEIATSRPPSAQEDETMSRALSDAMRQNPPSAFRSPQLPPEGSSSTSSFGLSQSQGARRPSSSASAASSNHSFYSAASSNAAPPMPRTPGGPGGLLRASVNYPSTPTAKAPSSQLGFTPRRSIAGGGAGGMSRPESRQESRPTSVRGVVGQYGVGEKVRVDSMGMEGTLRFVGEIAGKPGAWAGVELSGGFAGKGKNDGSVGETRYFTCPPMCGIFLQYSKLSSPTTGPGSARPSSVMSNRSSVRGSESMSGRVTPSISGRATPSGRSTPSHGNFPRPPPLSSSLQQSRTASKSSAEASALAESNITAGSRASKYLGMTAKQLNSRTTTNLNETVGSSSLSKSISTPRAPRLSGISGIGQPTPTRSSYAPRLSLGPASTPGRSGRSSAAGVRSTPTSEMPPPPSPSKMLRPGPVRPSSRQSDAFGSRPHSRASEVRPQTPKSSALLDLEKNNFALQGKIAKLTGAGSASSSGRASVQSNRSSRRSSDVREDDVDDDEENEGDKTFTTPAGSHTDAEFEQQRLRIDQLRIRVDGLEKENLTLLLDGKKSPDPNSNNLNQSRMESGTSSDARAVAAERQVQAHTTRLTILQSELSASSQTTRTLQSSIEALEQAALQTQEERLNEQEESKQVQKELGTKLEESERLIGELRERVEAKERAEMEREEEAGRRKKEIEGLQFRVERLDEELEQERNELGGQVDALRKAGQDTIMLYEERLNAAEALRFDMESAIRSLSDQLDQTSFRNLEAPPSPSSLSRQASTAAEIDNENLTEQVKHLTNKISSLEDQLEELQVQAERDELAANKKLERSKENEVRLKGEVGEVRGEMEEAGKRENAARLRMGEVEEALKENGVALENARAEIEGLRAEVTNLENLQAGVQTDEHDQFKEAASRADVDKTRLETEIETLKNKLEDAMGEVRQAVETANQARKDGEERKTEIEDLRADLRSALEENDELLHTNEDLEAKFKKLSTTSSTFNSSSPSTSSNDALAELRQQHARENDLLVEEIRSLKRKLGSPVSPNGTEEFLISENNSPAIPQNKTTTTEKLSKKGSRESLTGSVASSSRSRLSIGAKDEDAVRKDQIRGFQHIIEELTRENSSAAAQLYALKNDKDQLLSETEDLRDTVKALELAMEESILLEEAKLDAEAAGTGLHPPPSTNGAPSSPSRDAARLAKQLAEAQVALESQSRRHDADFERYQKKLAEIDQKNLREVHELESLIESKIYREDELEREIEDLKYEITKSGISKIKTNGHHAMQSRRNGDDLTPKLGTFAAQKFSDGDACELCDDPTHDIQFCPLFSGAGEQSSYDPESFDENELNSPLANKGHVNSSKGRPSIWCEDCESTDHSTEDCVYAQEVF